MKFLDDGKVEKYNKSHTVILKVKKRILILPAKYSRVVFSQEVDNTLKEICIEISKWYQIYFLELETDKTNVHFLLQSVPRYSPTEIVTMIKSITAREIYKKHPEVKKILWGGEFWSDGYFVNTVSKFGDEETITKVCERTRKRKRVPGFTQNKTINIILTFR